MKAIPYRLFKRLAKLTSINKRNINRKIDDLCPDHAKALKIAGLSPKKFPPSLREILKLKSKSKKKNKKKNRTTYFCIGVYNTWIIRNTWNNVVSIKRRVSCVLLDLLLLIIFPNKNSKKRTCSLYNGTGF